MAYIKTNWINDSVPAINASNLNNIEEGIFQAHENIEKIKEKILNTHSDSQTDVYSCDYVNKLNIYSTEETVIGTWLGKPLYRKVISINTDYINKIEFSHGIENYDKIWIDISNSYYFTDGVCVPLVSTNYHENFGEKTGAMIYKDNVILYSTGGWNTDWTKVITINYTKTTD